MGQLTMQKLHILHIAQFVINCTLKYALNSTFFQCYWQSSDVVMGIFMEFPGSPPSKINPFWLCKPKINGMPSDIFFWLQSWISLSIGHFYWYIDLSVSLSAWYGLVAFVTSSTSVTLDEPAFPKYRCKLKGDFVK